MEERVDGGGFDWWHVQRALNIQIAGYVNVVFGSPESALERVPELSSATASHDNSELLEALLKHYTEIAAMADLDDELRLMTETVLVWHDSLHSQVPQTIPLLAVQRLFELLSVPTQEDEIAVVLARGFIDAALDSVERN